MLIQLKNLSKSYTNGKIAFKALDNINLTINRNEFVAIMGPSGSGKSTLLHILGLLDRPSSGEYLFYSQPIQSYSDNELAQLRSAHLGFIFQQFHLLPRTSAYRNVFLPMIYSDAKKEPQKPVQLLSKVGLSQKITNHPNELSGGERQRVAIARALVNDPEIIFADEPTGNLDSTTEKEIMTLLSELHKQGKTVILITHEENLAKNADRVIRLKDGCIISDEYLKETDPVNNNLPTSLAKTFFRPLQLVEYTKQAFSMIFSNKIRSFLSMLGILIGVGTVVAMMMLGAGAKASIEESLARLGTNMITIRQFRRTDQVPVRFTAKDVEMIKKLEFVKYITPQVDGSVTLIYGNNNLTSQVTGLNNQAQAMRSNKPEFGRFFTEQEDIQREKVAIVGKTIVKDLFNNQNPIGQIIKINKQNFRVIGILPTLGGSSWRDQDNTVIIPISTAMYRLLGKKYYNSIDIEITDSALIESAIERIKELIITKHNLKGKRTEVFRIINMAEIQQTFETTTQNLSFLMSFIASLSLLVGGIGIMNIMLVSVTERTREIGLRKAIGATKRDILFQFIIEAVMMTLSGGFLGITCGISIAWSLSLLANWTVKLTPFSMFLAAFFSISVGLIFGIWPAKKASGLNPIQALRYE
ncbi:ABC transporter permease [Thermoproteota archaeon]